MIIGIDEVGRGAWAGPLCVAAVALDGVELPGLTDSKKLTAIQRQRFALAIKQRATYVGIGWASNKVIDQYGMTAALKHAAARAVAALDLDRVESVIIDGTLRLLNHPAVTTMAKADLLVPSVSAASVVAKVARDSYMAQLAYEWPDYGFASHVGYGTPKHRAVLADIGPSPVHRHSFAPLVAARANQPSAGAQAEAVAADYLRRQGFYIIDQNWKTKWCEIDIIARKGSVVHFVEVKYRRSSTWGDGLAAITPKKLRQMAFAAKLWLSQTATPPAACQLAALSLSGQPIVVERWEPRVG